MGFRMYFRWTRKCKHTPLPCLPQALNPLPSVPLDTH